MNRIRYIKNAEGAYTPMRRITNADGAQFDVTYKVLDDGVSCQGVVSMDGVALLDVIKQSHFKIKIAIKKVLVKNGVAFTKETRGVADV